MKYDQLEQHAKDYALQQHAEHTDWEWWDFVCEDFVAICACMGFEVTQLTKRGYDINFSGFCSQGDGAGFSAAFSLRDGLEATTKIQAYCNDAELASIAQDVFAACSDAAGVSQMLTWDGIALRAGIKQESRSFYMSVVSESIDFVGVEHADEPEVIAVCEAFDEAVLQAARDLAAWLYKTLEAEWTYLTSEQSLREAAEANEWEFDESGCITFDKELKAA